MPSVFCIKEDTPLWVEVMKGGYPLCGLTSAREISPYDVIAGLYIHDVMKTASANRKF